MVIPTRFWISLPMLFLCAWLWPQTAASHDVTAGSDDDASWEPAIYPTDRCVSQKIAAAANHCKRAFAAATRDGDGEEAKHSRRLRKAAKKLAKKWARAEAIASAAGVDCAQTSIASEEMAGLIAAAAERIASTISSGRDPGDDDDHHGKWHKREERRGKAAAKACDDLLEAQSDHLARRGSDRLRLGLDRDTQVALDRFRRRWRKRDHGDPEDAPRAEIEDRLQGLVDEVVAAATVSPTVPTDWTRVDPDAVVEYKGEALEPICSGGTPYAFWVRRGTLNKLLVYYQGGGACWNAVTCAGVPGLVPPTFKRVIGDSDDPGRATMGFADHTNPANPFRDWNAVFVSYCTGDVHWGDAVVEHRRGTLATTTYHKGFVNAQVVEKWAREHFAFPQQVFVTGSSAGAYGAIVNSAPLQEFVYPSSDFAVLGDAGNGVITDAFVRNDISKWGIEKNLPDYIPALNVPITQLSAADLWAESAKHFGENRFGTYTTAYDGGTGGQTGFFHVMTCPSVLDWSSWWRSACNWNDEMRALNQTTVSTAANYRFYIGSGSRHTMWGNDKVYTDTTGGVPPIVDWVNAMLTDSPDWVNVECSDCGIVLPGDPTPPSPQPPFTSDGRIDCSVPPDPVCLQ